MAEAATPPGQPGISPDTPEARQARNRRAARRAANARGLAGEEQAGTFLAAQGFSLLARRLRTPAGEIDLIARKGDLLIFCEVKQRTSVDAAAASLSQRQRGRIVAAAECFLASQPELSGLDMRFDAILIARNGALRHLPGAFDCTG
ncbi:YraN family protein [Xanthobacter sp. TB0139]|uniref:YraN family protein n=1 Tax=Xanthobacter sp. TB0139 TaxID=3459178 RepID=UPI00403A7164